MPKKKPDRLSALIQRFRVEARVLPADVGKSFEYPFLVISGHFEGSRKESANDPKRTLVELRS